MVLRWTKPTTGELGIVEIWDSDTADWNDASRRLADESGLGARSLTIAYPAGTQKWFWAFNVVNGVRSARFGDDISAVTATSITSAAAPRIIKAVIGNAPRNREWVVGTLWIDPTNGRQWRGEPDPWNAFSQPGTYVASTKTVTYDDSKQNLVLGSDVSWTSAEGRIPEYGLDRTLFAVRGMANVEGLNDGVLFALQSGITSFLATNQYGFVIEQSVPDVVFAEGTENAILNSLDVNLTTGTVTAVFRDDVLGNYAVGPSFRKDGDKYTFVVRLGTTVYALPVKAGDDDDPYELVPPTGFIAAVRARRAAAAAGTELPNASVALVDEDDLEALGTQWLQAFASVTRVQQAEYVTPYTGSDDVSPFSWPSVGNIPDFVDGAMQVLQLDRINLNWTPERAQPLGDDTGNSRGSNLHRRGGKTLAAGAVSSEQLDLQRDSGFVRRRQRSAMGFLDPRCGLFQRKGIRLPSHENPANRQPALASGVLEPLGPRIPRKRRFQKAVRSPSPYQRKRRSLGFLRCGREQRFRKTGTR